MRRYSFPAENKVAVIRVRYLVFQNAHRLQVRYGIIAPVVLVNEYLQVRLRISDRKIFVVDVETYLLMALVGVDVRVPAHRSEILTTGSTTEKQAVK